MNRAEMIDALIERSDLSRKDAMGVINSIFHPADGMIARALKKGDKVTITGFGVFGVRKRAARKARNPQTGEAIKVGASKAAGFKAGASLKATLNGKATATKSASKTASKTASKSAAKSAGKRAAKSAGKTASKAAAKGRR